MHRQRDFNTMFKAIDEEGRRYVMAVLQGEYERVCESSPPRLSLVRSTKIVSSLPKGQINPLPVGSTG